MPLRLLVGALASALALAACGSAPDAPSPDRILIVPATAARDAAATVRAAPVVAAVASRNHAPTLTVEESARINTSEMWSEPIDPEAEEVEIE